MRTKLAELLINFPKYLKLAEDTEALRDVVERTMDTHPEQALDMMFIVDGNMLDLYCYHNKIIQEFLDLDIKTMDREAMDNAPVHSC